MTSHTLSRTIPAEPQVGSAPVSNGRLWASRLAGGLAVLFFVLDGGMKLFKPAFVVKATLQLGYPASAIVGIGVTLLACTLLYVLPRTSVLGAILLTGYLGGRSPATCERKPRHSTSCFRWSSAVLYGAVCGCAAARCGT